MPSLRRSLSSPSVRSSPYPTALSSSISAGRTNGHGYRRSSGTETSSRRVLADLEWWRVVDGQHDVETELESDDSGLDQQQGYVTDDDTRGAEHTLTPLPWSGVTLHIPHSPEAYNLPTSQFAALSIAPRGHTLESSSSSVESTPLDGLRLSFGFALLEGNIMNPAISPLSSHPRDLLLN